MASRTEQCNGCGRYLLVSPEAQAFQCSACHAITRVGPSDHWVRAYDAVVHRPTGQCGSGPHCYSNGYKKQPRLTLSPPSAHGRKRAVLCGVSYLQTTYKLKGSVNDVKRMRYLLVEKLKFPSDCVLTLTEEEWNPIMIPTKQNIRSAMRWLVQNCQPGDSLVFYFSGHGRKQKDYNHDELDGTDEALCPVDHETEGPIIDDEINGTIVRPLPPGVKLHAIIDACFSGTVLDLQFVCNMESEGYYEWEDQTFPAPRPIYKGTSGGLAVCISACDDDQISESTAAFTGKVTGVLTFNFTKIVHAEPGLTYGRLINAMRNEICKKDTDKLQVPQLSSSSRFDIYSTPFIL